MAKSKANLAQRGNQKARKPRAATTNVDDKAKDKMKLEVMDPTENNQLNSKQYQDGLVDDKFMASERSSGYGQCAAPVPKIQIYSSTGQGGSPNKIVINYPVQTTSGSEGSYYREAENE